MGRQPRFFVPGYPQHIVQRGNDRQPCFFETCDYLYYLRCVAEASEIHRCDVHAYVLMTNHVHLLVTPGERDAIPKFMQSIGRKFVKAVNERRSRTGTLWEGRYKATIVDTDEYLLACYRYIESNPVRAGMVSHPSLYRWSSYEFHAATHQNDFIRDHSVFMALGTDRATRAAAYKKLFETALSAEQLCRIRHATNKAMPLGDDEFQSTVAENSNRRRGAGSWGGMRTGSGRPRGR